MIDDGLINKEMLLKICVKLINEIITFVPSDIKETFFEKLNKVVSIGDKNIYEKHSIKNAHTVLKANGLKK